MTPVAPFRLDKWLWQARFFKSRTMAAGIIEGGAVRVNGTRAVKPAHPLRPGDTLTFAQGGRIRLVRVLMPAARRGPPDEAQRLYLDLEAPSADPPGAENAPAPLE